MDIKSMTLDELKDACQQMGEKPFRAKQLYDWMHHRLAGSYDEMTNLSLAFREKLKEQYPLTCLEKVQVQESKIDGTRKYLFRLSDGNVIESVWMKYHHGNSVCISSQVGCRMGCRFCASTIGGLVRCLTPSEMLDQIYRIQEDTGERVSNLVADGQLRQSGALRAAAFEPGRTQHQPEKHHRFHLRNRTEYVQIGR